MTHNRHLAHVNPLDVERIEKAQVRLLRAKKRLGNWRAVGDKLGVYHTYAWNLALNGIVPPNPETRKKLTLPRVLPSERKRKRVTGSRPKVWESPELYLRKVKK